ncbi:MAG: hypothetical protein H6577_05510 [Lewinellaceae bacterium]|nr:hypothetical protein [Saprospiraceae bacterium]MCB9337562.1 hypothetical protein [Lewinellaceae bacterium]
MNTIVWSDLAFLSCSDIANYLSEKYSLDVVSAYSQDAIPDASGGKSKFTNTYKYYRIVNANSGTGWLTLKYEFTFNIGSKYNIKSADAFGRSYTYYRLGKTEEFQIGDKKGWISPYAIWKSCLLFMSFLRPNLYAYYSFYPLEVTKNLIFSSLLNGNEHCASVDGVIFPTNAGALQSVCK